VLREGQGEELLLVHGGAGPRATWGALEPLAARWTLAHVYRRGYPPSPPPPDGRQDFERDALDIEPLLESRPHLIAHSYGTLGALIAAGRRPDSVRSLTMIEPPLFYLASGDPEVERLEALSVVVLNEGVDAEPAALREFLQMAGVADLGPGPLPEAVAAGVSRGHRMRQPNEARPRLEALREAGVPALVASGDHSPGLEAICDGLAEALAAERLVAPGAGHFVAAAPDFPGASERFLGAVD